MNNSYVVKDISDIPLDKLEIGNHVVLFEESLVSEYSSREVEKTNVLVFSELNYKYFYNFEGQSMYSDIDEEEKYKTEDENEEPEIVTTASMDVNKIYRTYMKLPNGELYLLGNSNHSGRSLDYYDNAFDEDEVKRGSFLTMIYERLFKERAYITMLLGRNKFKQSYSSFEILPFKLDDDAYIVFLAKSTIDGKYKTWDKVQNTFLFLRDGSVIQITVDFKKFIKKLKTFTDTYGDNQTKYFNDFEKTVEMMSQKIIDVIRTDKETLFKLEFQSYFRQFYDLDEINMLFEPVYSNEELGLEVFPGGNDRIFGNARMEFYRNGERLRSWGFEEAYPELLLEKRKANAVFLFTLNRHYSGLSPFDGKIYNYGALDEKAMQDKNYYMDYEGAMISSKGNLDYYVKIDGLYIKAEAEDKALVDELLDRKKMVNQLEKWGEEVAES
jgi:hypothetical protein